MREHSAITASSNPHNFATMIKNRNEFGRLHTFNRKNDSDPEGKIATIPGNVLVEHRYERYFGSCYIPNTPTIRHLFDSHVFCCQYSSDGTMFATACQDRAVRIFNTDTWEVLKTVDAPEIGWAILSTDFSRDGNWVAYSGWNGYAYLVNTATGEDAQHVSLPFANVGFRRGFSLFSVKFSHDSTELLAGSGDNMVKLMNIETKQLKYSIQAHQDDVNCIAWADSSSTVFFSGSDDTAIHIWDKRTLGSQSRTPAGVLHGHMHGITYMDSRGDGRYLISNGKDQCIKLWDIRTLQEYDPERISSQYYNDRPDYRLGRPNTRYSGRRLTNDCSIMTYRGHTVSETLIRCKFSPKETTGQRYIYSGSSDGQIYIYDILTGKLVKTLIHHREIVRDLDWHPHIMTLTSTGWDGNLTEWHWTKEAELQGQ